MKVGGGMGVGLGGAPEGSPKAANICPIKTHMPTMNNSRGGNRVPKERRDGRKSQAEVSGSSVTTR